MTDTSANLVLNKSQLMADVSSHYKSLWSKISSSASMKNWFGGEDGRSELLILGAMAGALVAVGANQMGVMPGLEGMSTETSILAFSAAGSVAGGVATGVAGYIAETSARVAIAVVATPVALAKAALGRVLKRLDERNDEQVARDSEIMSEMSTLFDKLKGLPDYDVLVSSSEGLQSSSPAEFRELRKAEENLHDIRLGPEGQQDSLSVLVTNWHFGKVDNVVRNNEVIKQVDGGFVTQDNHDYDVSVSYGDLHLGQKY